MQEPRSPARSPRAWIRIVAVLAALAGLFAAFELSARVYLMGIAGLSPVRVNSLGLLHQPRYTRMSEEPRIGFELRPDLDDYFKLVAFRTNSQGLRDREVSLEKPPGTFRVAVVGASFALPSGVAIEEAFHTRLEEQLAPELAPRIPEFVNFAVGMHGPWQTLAMLELRALAYAPDLVLFTVTSLSAPGLLSDPPASPPDPRPFAEPTLPMLRSYFLRLLVSRTRPGPGFSWSRVGALERAVLDLLGPTPAVAGRDERAARSSRLPQPEEKPVARELAEISRRTGIPIAVVRLSRQWRPQSGDPALASAAQRLGLYYHDTRRAFEGTDPHRFWVLPFDMHPNAAAHQRFADSIGAFLRERGLLARVVGRDRSPAPGQRVSGAR